MFPEDTILRPDPQLPSTEIDGEIVLMNCLTDSYYSLSETAAAVWKALKPGASLQSICQTLLREYTVDEETCRRDVSAFLQMLLQQGLIQTAEA
ncbi:MAG TPA: PqqD family protein [Bryobacteraceae bacterium]|nr:PqqD family protein [Bryobacteraceae bacterium]